MKKFKMFLVLGMALSVTIWAQSGNAPVITQSFSRGYFIDSRLHGTWVKEGNPQLQFVFYANTWRIIDNNVRINSGVFIMNNNTIACFFSTWEINERGSSEDKFNFFEMDYVLQSNNLTISNMNEYLNGRWNRVNTPQPPVGNSVVGTWREIENDGLVLIYQFYSDGTGVFHSYDTESGVLYRSDNFVYNSNTRTFSFNYTAHGDGYIIEGGRLFFINHLGQRVGTLDRI